MMSAARARFGNWTALNVARAGFTNMVNQIQVGTFSDSVEWEQLGSSESARVARCDTAQSVHVQRVSGRKFKLLLLEVC